MVWCKRGGRIINVWDEYVAMLGSIREFLFGGEFLNNEKYRRGIKKTLDVQTAVRRYIRDVYGCSFSQTYNLVHGVSVKVNHNVIYDALIDYYGIDGMDWGYLSRGVRCFYTDNDKILEYIANDTLVKGDIYNYFIKNHALKVDGVGINTSRKDGRARKVIILKWSDGGRVYYIHTIYPFTIYSSHNHIHSKIVVSKNLILIQIILIRCVIRWIT